MQPDDRQWEPLAYFDGSGAVVAVLALAHGKNESEIVNLAVDADHQNVGLGTEVVTAVIDRCRARGATSVGLTVNPRNEVAARLYRRVGFAPTGKLRHDEPVWSLRLTDESSAP